MSGVQSEILRHTKKQENTFCNKEVNQSIKTDPELTQVLELADRTLNSYCNCAPYVQKIKYQGGYLKGPC